MLVLKACFKKLFHRKTFYGQNIEGIAFFQYHHFSHFSVNHHFELNASTFNWLHL